MARTRRLIVAVLCVALLVGAALGAGRFLALAAPFTGDAWSAAAGANEGSVGSRLDRAATGPRVVESPYGEATVRFDGDGVPHVTADSERALAFAVGYVQARDRLFQMDLGRRLMRGRLAAAFGERAVASDRFHRRMGFSDAAAASWAAVEDTPTGASIVAYTAGVNRYIETRPLPTEFRLNGHQPARWRPTDTLLVGKLIAWRLTGDFRDLRRATVAARLDGASDLYGPLDHDATILGRATGGERASLRGPGRAGRIPGAGATPGDGRPRPYAALYDALASYEREPGIGSNSWAVAGEHTDTGRPILANDPHLSLSVPPVWYEMHLRVRSGTGPGAGAGAGSDGDGDGDGGDGTGSETGDGAAMDVRGVAFPGLPTVVIGHNRDVAWGFTNLGADVTDVYTYAWRGEDRYVHAGRVRETETRTETIPVDGAPDETVTVRRTVHGPVLEREGRRVAVAWPGLSATREAVAVRRLNRADGLDDVRAALSRFDAPTQNLVAIDRSGGVAYWATGRVPYRYTDGERVRGDRPFNGTRGEGTWRGYEPYGRSDWDAGFVPVGEMPHAVDPGYVATANQRVVDDPGFYLSADGRYADPYRGARIYGRLERRVASDDPVTTEWTADLQADTRSRAARQFVPQLANATGAMRPRTRAAVEELSAWDGRMDRDSRAAVLFALFRERVRNATLGDEFARAGLDESYYPRLSRIGDLPADSRWFDDVTTPDRETRADVYARALWGAIRAADRNGWGTYGEYNRLDVDHPFPLAALDYPEGSVDGSPYTVSNYRRDGPAGSSWRMIVGSESAVGVLPGGQSGNPYSPHYDDQLSTWAANGYHDASLSARGPTVLRFANATGSGEP